MQLIYAHLILINHPNLRRVEFYVAWGLNVWRLFQNYEDTIFKMMSEVEPLELEFLSAKEKKSPNNVDKNCTTKTILLVAIVLLVLLCFAFILLYTLEKISNAYDGKNEEIKSVSNGIPTAKSSCCFTQTCIQSSFRKCLLCVYKMCIWHTYTYICVCLYWNVD